MSMAAIRHQTTRLLEHLRIEILLCFISNQSCGSGKDFTPSTRSSALERAVFRQKVVMKGLQRKNYKRLILKPYMGKSTSLVHNVLKTSFLSFTCLS
jgi:hypothetical protein